MSAQPLVVLFFIEGAIPFALGALARTKISSGASGHLHRRRLGRRRLRILAVSVLAALADRVKGHFLLDKASTRGSCWQRSHGIVICELFAGASEMWMAPNALFIS